MSISLIIPTYRNPKYLDLCLKSATENKVLDDSEIIVIVDGYPKESSHVLEKYPDILILEFNENRGMQYALNAGVSQANNPLVFIANDDNVFPREWDRRVVSDWDSIRTKRQKVMLTVNQVEPTGPGMFNFHVKDFGKTVEAFQYDAWLDYEETISEPIWKSLDGHIFPFVMEKKHYMAVGGFDTLYDSPNLCDWDFALRLELLDFSFPRTQLLHLYHFGSISTKKNAESEKFKAREAAAAEVYRWKWGVEPTNEPGTNSKLPLDGKFRGFEHIWNGD